MVPSRLTNKHEHLSENAARLFQADLTEEEATDELQVFTVTACGFPGHRPCQSLRVRLCAVALCDIFGCVTHRQHYSRPGRAYINNTMSDTSSCTVMDPGLGAAVNHVLTAPRQRLLLSNKAGAGNVNRDNVLLCLLNVSQCPHTDTRHK